MRFAGNVIWFISGGWLLALVWLIGALVFAISIVGLPLTKAAIEIAKMAAFPFGKDVVHIRELDNKSLNKITATTGTIGFIANVIWALTFGWALCFLHIVIGMINFIFIIPIPFALQSFKLAGISFWPVGRRVVSVELAKHARVTNAKDKLKTYRAKS